MNFTDYSLKAMLRKLPKKKICKECKKEFKPYNPLQPVCSPLCALNYNKKQANKKEAREWKEKRKKIVEKLKTISDYEREARTVFQKWIRFRDKDFPCISCGRIANEYDAGHYFPAGQFSGLIFNEMNVHKQCSRPCNKDLSGNIHNYRDGLIKRYGLDYVHKLESFKEGGRNYKYSKEELIEIKTKYTQKLAALKCNTN